MKRFLPVYIWGAFILTLSSIPNLETPGPKVFGLDKVAHLGEYLILMFLIFRASQPEADEPPAQKPKKFVNLIPFILLLALLDELHQKFIPGREVELSDLGFNFIGILLGWLLWRKK